MFGFAWSVFIGISLGFGFGVGCALAVMYSIFMGGYRAALREARLPEPTERYLKESARIQNTTDSVRS